MRERHHNHESNIRIERLRGVPGFLIDGTVLIQDSEVEGFLFHLRRLYEDVVNQAHL